MVIFSKNSTCHLLIKLMRRYIVPKSKYLQDAVLRISTDEKYKEKVLVKQEKLRNKPNYMNVNNGIKTKKTIRRKENGKRKSKVKSTLQRVAELQKGLDAAEEIKVVAEAPTAVEADRGKIIIVAGEQEGQQIQLKFA